MLKKIKNNIFLGIGFATIVYFILIIYNDYSQIYLSISNYPILYLFIAQFLIVLSLIVKFFRWNYYLGILGINIKLWDSILIFNSGLLMSITPGKVGELLKSFLIKENYDFEISESSSVVIAERIIEFIALIILGIVGVLIYSFGLEYLAIATFILFILLFIVMSSKTQSKIYKNLQKFRFLKKYIENIELFRRSLDRLFTKIHFGKSLFLSFLAWIFECMAFYIILLGFSNNISITWSIFIYSFSLFIGSISMLPGGIGTTEGSLIFLMTKNMYLENSAFTATILIRVITLWVPIIIGFISLLLYLKRRKDVIS